MTRDSDRSGPGLPPRDRGQSISINYTLSLIIVTVLIAGLFVAMSGYLETERENVTRAELEVLGNRIAADIATADRLARTTETDARVEVRTTIPRSVAGSEYEVTITSSDPGLNEQFNVEIELRAPTVGVSKNVSTRTEIEVDNSNLHGGPFEVVYDGTTIEVKDG